MSTTTGSLRFGLLLPIFLFSACLAGGPWYTTRGLEVLQGEGIDDTTQRALHDGIAGVPAELQLQLSRHPDFHVRCVAAAYRAARTDILESLSYDQDERVRMEVGHNPTTPAWVIARLKTDSSELVRTNIRPESH